MRVELIINDYLAKRKRAARLYRRLRELEDRAKSPPSSANYCEVKSRGTKTREDLFVTIADTREEWRTAALDELEARQYLFDLVLKLKDPEESDVLYYRFVECMTVKQAKKKLKYCGEVRQIFRKQKTGLKHLEKIAAEEEKEHRKS